MWREGIADSGLRRLKQLWNPVFLLLPLSIMAEIRRVPPYRQLCIPVSSVVLLVKCLTRTQCVLLSVVPALVMFPLVLTHRVVVILGARDGLSYSRLVNGLSFVLTVTRLWAWCPGPQGRQRLLSLAPSRAVPTVPVRLLASPFRLETDPRTVRCSLLSLCRQSRCALRPCSRALLRLLATLP